MSSRELGTDIIIQTIFIIKCNLSRKTFRIKLQSQTTKQDKNFQAKIKSCNKWFRDRIVGIYPGVWPVAGGLASSDLTTIYRRQSLSCPVNQNKIWTDLMNAGREFIITGERREKCLVGIAHVRRLISPRDNEAELCRCNYI